MLTSVTAPKPKLRWCQFTLRTLIIVVTLCAIPCSWLAVKLQEKRRQREAAAVIERLGGVVKWSEPSGPVWLRSLLDDEMFASIERASLGRETTDSGLAHLTGLTQLRGSLSLANTQVTDAGLVHLTGLTQLQGLSLANTQVTDAGLVHLTGLTQLQGLSLNSTRVTDRGLAHLEGLKQLRELLLAKTQVSDAGLGHLERLAQLQVLWVDSTQVTLLGVKKLSQALPDCDIAAH